MVLHGTCQLFSEFNLNQLLDEFNSELPDELGNLGPGNGDGTQNGAKMDAPLPPPDNAPQKHQQLSQLLSSTTPTPSSTASPQQNQVHPGPAQSPNVAGLNTNLNSLNNAVKSPLSNSLGSPMNTGVAKGPNTSLPHSLTNELLTNSVGAAYSNVGMSSSTITSSPLVGAMSMANTLSNSTMTSQALLNSGNVNLHQQNQFMNGPQMRMNAVPGGAATALSSLPGTLPNSNMGNSLAAAGQLQNPPQQGLNHPGLNAQPSLMQVRTFILVLCCPI